MKYFALLLGGLLFTSCRESQKDKIIQEETAIYKNWINKKIVLPPLSSGSLCVNCEPGKFENHTGYLVVTVFDISCSSCMETLGKWREFIKTMSKHNIKTAFVIPPELSGIYEQQKDLFTGLTLYFDKNYDFVEKNQISPDKTIQTMLIDKDNRIVILGNPTASENIKGLYLKFANNLR